MAVTSLAEMRKWSFDGSLKESSGACPFRGDGGDASFVSDCGSVALGMSGAIWKTNDEPDFDLVPGLQFSLRLKLDSLTIPNGWATILRKGRTKDRGAYFLRVNRPDEGGRLALFVNVDGVVEPRVVSAEPVTTGRWYTVTGGWDGTRAYLAVDGKTNSVARLGMPSRCVAPLTLGPFKGAIAKLAIGTHDRTMPDGESLLPGLLVSCTAKFTQIPKGETAILKKPGEYLLRYDRPLTRKDGEFNFFLNLDGKWEPRLTVRENVETGRNYRVSLAWNGKNAALHVDGAEATGARQGAVAHSAAHLVTGGGGVEVRNPRTSVLSVPEPFLEDVIVKELMPYEGRPFTLIAKCGNNGEELPDCRLTVEGVGDISVSPRTVLLGDLRRGSSVPVEFRVEGARRRKEYVRFSLYSGKCRVLELVKPVIVMPSEVPSFRRVDLNPPVSGRVVRYIDSRGGDDAADGLSPATAWRSFKRVNGRRLGSGERLLLRRGSVFGEELKVSASATKDDWAEIAAYGEGFRPTIRRNRFIDDRCALIENPKYLVIRDLVVCNAGKGLDIPGADGLIIENCLAHHVEGLYLVDSHGIPEWRGRTGAPGGCTGDGYGGGIAANGSDIVMRECEMYQCSSAFRLSGAEVGISRVFCHDNFCHNTSPHPYFTCTDRAWLVDSVFDSAGWNASAGTMGIMLAFNHGLVVRNCHFLNIRDSGVPDQGGIDFEAGGENVIVEGCTFRNNAGAAIEVLGLSSPQVRNLQIRGCRFDRNNHTLKHVPSEVFVWGRRKERNVLVSNGLISGNGYVLAPGVVFYTNQAERTRAQWKLTGNNRYATSEELNKAMPLGDPPAVVVAEEYWTDTECGVLNATVKSSGSVDGAKTLLRWEQLEGPENAVISNRDCGHCNVRLPECGDYRFLFKADNGVLWRSVRQAVHRVPAGVRIAKAWTFSRDLDPEGWTFEGLGTEREIVKGDASRWNTVANPVHIVGGDYFTLAVKTSSCARICSPPAIGVSSESCSHVRIRLNNHTSSRLMRILYTTKDRPCFSCDRSVVFPVEPYSVRDAVCVVPIAFDGELDRLRIDFSADGSSVNGTCRIDYIALSKE